MAKVEVYYDYYDGELCPQWMVVKFGKGKIDWAKKFAYLPIELPFKRKTAEEFCDIEMGLSVTLVDLVMNTEKEGYFGISLSSIKDRVNKMRGRGEFPYLIEEVETFIIQICDLEEALACHENKHYAWR